jgi:predicted DNA-binding transcriptional regulator AlpA
MLTGMKLQSAGIVRDSAKPKKPRRPFNPGAEIVSPFYLPFVVGLSSTTCWRLRRRGLFPEPLKLSVKRVGWRRADLEAWLSNRQVGR